MFPILYRSIPTTTINTNERSTTINQLPPPYLTPLAQAFQNNQSPPAYTPSSEPSTSIEFTPISYTISTTSTLSSISSFTTSSTNNHSIWSSISNPRRIPTSSGGLLTSKKKKKLNLNQVVTVESRKQKNRDFTHNIWGKIINSEDSIRAVWGR